MSEKYTGPGEPTCIIESLSIILRCKQQGVFSTDKRGGLLESDNEAFDMLSIQFNSVSLLKLLSFCGPVSEPEPNLLGNSNGTENICSIKLH